MWLYSFLRCVGSTIKQGELTPFSIANTTSTAEPALKPVVPKALGVHTDVDPEEAERDRGNLDFKNGNFTAAVKSYTKCLGMKVLLFLVALMV